MPVKKLEKKQKEVVEITVVEPEEARNFLTVQMVSKIEHLETHTLSALCKNNRVKGSFRAKLVFPVTTKPFWLIPKDYKIDRFPAGPKVGGYNPGAAFLPVARKAHSEKKRA